MLLASLAADVCPAGACRADERRRSSPTVSRRTRTRGPHRADASCQLCHYAIDLVLISCCLAGIRRSTGLSVSLARLHNRDVCVAALSMLADRGRRQLFANYLSIGGASARPGLHLIGAERVLDTTVVAMSNSQWFERRR